MINRFKKLLYRPVLLLNAPNWLSLLSNFWLKVNKEIDINELEYDKKIFTVTMQSMK